MKLWCSRCGIVRPIDDALSELPWWCGHMVPPDDPGAPARQQMMPLPTWHPLFGEETEVHA